MNTLNDPLATLNSSQRQAVTAPLAPVLVLAGAGSGKTRVLVHRIAWLIQTQQVKPHHILAVTFTNKAAHEMRERIEALLQIPVQGMWVGTFHGLGHRLLRIHHREAELAADFQILDADDQLRLIKRILKELEIDEERCPPRKVQWFINARKDEGQRAQDLDAHQQHPGDAQLIRVYAHYEQTCARNGVVDFAELLLRALQLLQREPALLAQYRQRFAHILVDEFQDTNTIQYHWLSLLAGKENPIFAVGDDDQSIYGWRGARIEHIQRFSRDFPHAKTVRLEQNYRSTANILDAANALIRQNTRRLGKELWTQDPAGERLGLYAAFNEVEEARYVAETIKHWANEGRAYTDAAILYRSNAQSRLFEEALNLQGIPYRIYGGQRFFDRAEIRDVLAYLRLLTQPEEDTSFERVVNHPPRGLGERSLEKLRAVASHHGVSLYQAACQHAAHSVLTPRAAHGLHGFCQLLTQLRAHCAERALHEQVDAVIAHSGLREYYSSEKGEKAQSRLDNLNELVNAARGFVFEQEYYPGMTPLLAFLSHTALDTGQTEGAQSGQAQDAVQLMTLHSAKGLEFPLVFLAGMEEGLFPHSMAINTPNEIGVEEERRLAYVGITRARERLVLSYAQSRRVYGKTINCLPSRFLGELPETLLEPIGPTLQVRQSFSAPARPPMKTTGNYRRYRTAEKPPSPGKAASGATADTPVTGAQGLALGQRVQHKKFGEGVITRFEVHPQKTRIEVQFARHGSKLLDMAFAKLTPLH